MILVRSSLASCMGAATINVGRASYCFALSAAITALRSSYAAAIGMGTLARLFCRHLFSRLGLQTHTLDSQVVSVPKATTDGIAHNIFPLGYASANFEGLD